MGPVPGQPSRGGPHSRSHNCLCHIVREPVKALQSGYAFNRHSIFNAITEELAQDLDLLPGEVFRWEGGDDGD